MEVKAISVKRPWASMIYRGVKTIETRTWATDYRGDVLICSSKKPNIPPAGFALCIAELVRCRRMTKADEGAAGCELYPRAWAWELRNVRKLRRPFPVKGSLGIYSVEIDPGQMETEIEFCDNLCCECGAKIPVTDNPANVRGDIQCRACRDRFEVEEWNP
jgi:hypothetical protein